MLSHRHLFLLGFMGSGKTYWGRLLAQRTGFPFLDLDDLIAINEAAHLGLSNPDSDNKGLSISGIFAKQGEAGFRILERDALRSLATAPPSVVATGGGTPCFFDNMDWMNAKGTTIYLKTPPAILATILRPEKDVRPLLEGLGDSELQGFIERKLAEREPFYLQAKVVLEQIEDESSFFQLLEKAMASA